MTNKQKYVVVEHKSNLSAALKETCQFSQRIKFTCLEVSLNYIVFGATSGGLYVFSRYPHMLLKLIPSKHGAVTHLAISPSEKSIAVATSRSVIVIITSCFTSTDFQYYTYKESKSSAITDIKWNTNGELYYGTNLGKVAVIIEPNILTKAIFQTPHALLMHLDSSICQIDCHSSLLLLSTLTRTYLCDTEKEQFTQIGKKLRNGTFGACFLMSNKNPEKEQVVLNNDAIKVFCNRPGARIWEAQLDATVTRTHQLKQFFKDSLTSWICVDDDNNAHSNMSTVEPKTESQELFNFTKILVMDGSHILTFNKEGFYVFDPKELNLLCHYSISNIKDVKVAKNFVYVCLDDMEVVVFGLYGLENVILKTLFNQQYHTCIQICICYHKDVLELIDNSDKIYLLSSLESKMCDCFNEDTILKSIFEALQNISKKKISEKLNNGIVVVINNGFQGETAVVNDSEKLVQKDEADFEILQQQYEWNQINEQVTMSKYKRLLETQNPDKFVLLLQKFNRFKSDQTQFWCYNSFLKYFVGLNYEKLIHTVDDNTLQFVFDGYCFVNYSQSQRCSCLFPLPSANAKKTQFYEIGCVLLTKFWDKDIKLIERLMNEVPFMWKYVVEHQRQDQDINVLLPLLLQFNNEDLFTAFVDKFKYDTWDSAIKILIKLQQKRCINCETKFEENCVVFKWAQLASFMVNSIGAQSTVNLLKHYAGFIKPNDLDAKFYQSCIFAAAFENFNTESKSHASLLNKTNDTLQLDKLIVNYLNDKCKMAPHKHCAKTKEFQRL